MAILQGLVMNSDHCIIEHSFFRVKFSYFLYIHKWVFGGSPKGEQVSLIAFVY